MQELLIHFDIKTVLIVGDLFHAGKNTDLDLFQNWMQDFSFRFVHDATHCNEEAFCVSGHTHPGVVINGRAKQRIKLPCFEVDENQMTLPAFSEFTGLNTNSCSENAVCYAFTENILFKV